MLLQVHDELVFEVPVAVLEEATARIKSVMEGVCAPILQLDVELRADAGSGSELGRGALKRANQERFWGVEIG